MLRPPDSIRVVYTQGDPSLAALVAESLTRLDDRFVVETMTTPAEALERLEEGHVECVVSDYDLPDGDGIDFLETVRESDPHLPFVLFTAGGDETVASRAISADVSDYIERRTDSGSLCRLASRIVDHVERYRIRRSLESRLGQQRLIAELGQRALTSGESQPLFDHAVEEVAAALDVDYTKVLEYHPDDHELLLRAGVGWTAGMVGRTTVDDGEDSQAGYTLRSEEPVVVEDLRTESRFRGPPLLSDHDVVSGISVPIGSPDAPWGVFGAHTTDERRFTRDDVNFVQSVANILATAIDRETRERKLERQNQRLEDFTRIIGHDLRNPMAVASGYVGLAREEHDGSHLRRAADALDQMGVLIDEMLSLMREGEWVETLSPVELRPVVTEVWRHLESGDATLRLRTDRCVRADNSSLKRLLTNLLTNAITHGGAGVTVTVGDLPDGFFVADDGPGIAPADREQIFDAGYSTAEHGTGLGLNFVWEIVEAHGWEICLTESDSGGARFEITGVAPGEKPPR